MVGPISINGKGEYLDYIQKDDTYGAPFEDALTSYLKDINSA